MKDVFFSSSFTNLKLPRHIFFRSMSVIHCHVDRKFIILDQELYLKHIYTDAKDWRIADCKKNFIWKKDLFYIERPFRITNHTEKKKKKKTV